MLLDRVRERGPVGHGLQLHFMWHEWELRRCHGRCSALRRTPLLPWWAECGDPLKLLVDILRAAVARHGWTWRVTVTFPWLRSKQSLPKQFLNMFLNRDLVRRCQGWVV